MPQNFALVSTHLSTGSSGVAKFGRTLASKIGVRFLSFSDANSLDDALHLNSTYFILNVKAEGLSHSETIEIEDFVNKITSRRISCAVIFHSFGNMCVELRLISCSSKVFATNIEIYNLIEVFRTKDTYRIWCPSLLDPPSFDINRLVRVYPTDPEHTSESCGLRLLTIGMSHKVNFKLLSSAIERFEEIDAGVVVHISSIPHEKYRSGNLEEVLFLLNQKYGQRISHLGSVTDNELHEISGRYHGCLLVYPSGARENNTTLYAAIDLGLPIFTNLDLCSPIWLLHNITCVDIDRLSVESIKAQNLERIASIAAKVYRAALSWPILTRTLVSHLDGPSN